MILESASALYGEPQWGVVGQTFPVGCAWSPDIVFHEYFAKTPDRNKPELQTQYGIYEPHCGLENLHMSFGHDGYIAEVMKPYLRDEALYMLRFHSLILGTATVRTTTSKNRVGPIIFSRSALDPLNHVERESRLSVPYSVHPSSVPKVAVMD